MSDEAETEEAEAPADEGDGKENLAETVRSVVGDVLGELFSTGKADVEDTAETGEADTPKASLTIHEVEETAARMIREAQDAMKPKKAPAKKEAAAPAPEAAPQHVPWYRKALWGE